MYLIRAESNFRLGTVIGANPLDDINEIRDRAKAPTLISLALEDILLERRKNSLLKAFCFTILNVLKELLAHLIGMIVNWFSQFRLEKCK
jgi:hypothetical protein